MDSLTIFGLFAVTAMLIFYAFEERNPLYILCFAGSCALGSIYGFLQGAWPFGVIEAHLGGCGRATVVGKSMAPTRKNRTRNSHPVLRKYQRHAYDAHAGANEYS
jgi:membrane associated rhomboid family serine protease